MVAERPQDPLSGMAITVTSLELDDPGDLRPASPPSVSYELERVDDPALHRWFYETIGADWSWTERLAWPEERWSAWADAVEGWVMVVDGERAGFFALRPHGHSVEIDIFGLLPAFHGRGLGGELLTRAIRRGFELGSRVWVHTCSLDSPQALPNYEARGMRVFRRERREYPSRTT